MQFSERERRQLEQLKDRLLRYESGSLPLATLISEVDFLVESLEEVPADQRAALRREWSVLEEVYADALDRGGRELSDESESLADRTVQKLTQLIAEIEV